MFWLLAFTGLLSLVYICIIKPLQYWKIHQVQQYNVLKTLKDSLASFIPTESPPDAIKRVYDDFPDQRYIGSYLFLTPILLIRDPNLVKQITIKDFDHFTDHQTILLDDKDPLLARNLLSLKGEKWRNMRNILSPSFTSSKLKTIFPLMISCAKQFINFFEKNKSPIIEVEMKDVFKRVACDVIATSAFGISCNSLENPNNEFFSKGTILFKTNFATFFKFIVLILLPKVGRFFDIQVVDKKLTGFFDNLISENIKARETQGIVRPDMIQLLVEAKKKTKKTVKDADQKESEEDSIDDDDKNQRIQLTDEDIFSQAFLFFFAGFDTVSTTMGFLAYNLAVNPDIQENLYKEVKESISNFGEDPTYENLMKMKYMDMVISENLRVAPTAPNTDRVCANPYIIQPTNPGELPVSLKVGDRVLIPIYGLHNDPKYFPNPKRFDPERFNDENKGNIIPGSYLPFGYGPRSCIGNRFALMEIKLIFFYILSNYKIVVIDNTPIPMKFAKNQLSFGIEGGYWVGLQKRSD